ncbi:MAG: divergent polysaccharide deacetylase family protein, partial [Proteobacteria bacterium]|nr:divergent polysaccharide deacetylase family protein [Pseudomonadota bacterium]
MLSRFAGYAGVQLDLASRVADQSGALRPIAQVLKTRGLMEFHPGGAPGAGAVVLKELRVPAAAADVVIDEQPTDGAIAQRLADLEARARANPGGAVGFARPYPATLLRLGPWIGSLAGKGITLVPVSALAREGP